MATTARALPRLPALAIDGVPRGLVVGLLLTAAVTSTVAPLATYTLTLVAFGMAHVVQELRYIRHRFGAWVGWWLLPVSLCLACICGARLVGVFGGLSASTGRLVELGLVLAIVLCSAPLWLRGSWLGRLGGLAATLGLGLGLVFAPLVTVLIVAVGHNWTPVPFVLEAVGRRDRPLVIAACAVVFLVVPAVIATGLPWAAASAIGLGAAEWSLLDAGSLTSHFRAYLPASWAQWASAQHLFSAIVFAQCTHYVMVLVVLPSLSGGPVGRLRTGPWAWLGIVALGLLTGAVFLIDFRFGRAFYGAFSAVHAWIELPLLLLVLTALGGGDRRS